MRKVYVTVVARLILDMDEGVPIDEVIQEMHYEFLSRTDGADIVDSDVVDFEVTDSK